MKLAYLLATALAGASIAGATAAQTQTQTPSATAEKLALAREIILASGGQAQMEKKLSAMFAATTTLSADAMPASTKVFAEQALNQFRQYMIEILPQLVAITEQAYADNLSEKEMLDYVTWLNSDSGRAIRDKSVAISTQVILAESPLIREIMPKMVDKAIDQVCQQDNCSVQDRSTLASVIAQSMPKN